MKSLIQAWARLVVEYRMLVILLGALGLVLAALPLKNLYFDNSNEMWFIQGDPALRDFDALVEHFGDNEYLLIGIAAREGDPDLFTPITFDMIYKITEFLENHESVTKVQSLTKYQIIRGEQDEMIVEDLVAENLEEFDGSDAAMQRAREAMAREDLAHYQLITPDLRHTLISARSEYIKGNIDHHVKLVQELKAFMEKAGFAEYGFQIHYTGTPVINEGFFSSSMKDQELTLPLMFLLMTLFLVLSFRSLTGILLPLLVILGSVLLTLSSIALFGWSMNMLNVTLPVILMAVGIGDSVHILIEFYHFRNQGMDSKEAAQAATMDLFIPCLNTSITTGLGFMAISVSRLKPLNEFGIAAAIGVVMAFILSMTLMPAILSFVQGKPSKVKQISEEGYVARLTANLTEHVFRFKWGIMGTSVALVLLGLVGASKLVVDSNFINFFKSDNVLKTDLDYFIDQYNGGVFLEYIVDSGRSASEAASGGVMEPKFLQRVEAFEAWLRLQPESGKTISLVDMIKKMNQSMHDDDPAAFALPDSRQLVAQYLLLYANSGPEEDLTDMKTHDERYMRVSQRLSHMSSNQMEAFMSKVRQKLDRDFPDLKIQLTGMPVLYTNMDSYIHSGIIKSFSIAIVSIGICFLILLRSFKYGLLALIPSLFPILIAAGLMGFMGINLNFVALVTASVTFGIAVDDSIHILTRYIRGRTNGMTRKEAVHKAISETGRALVYTTLILFFGFSILMLSTFIPNIHLGFFAGVILMLALAASLTLLPSVMFFKGDAPAKTPQPKP